MPTMARLILLTAIGIAGCAGTGSPGTKPGTGMPGTGTAESGTAGVGSPQESATTTPSAPPTVPANPSSSGAPPAESPRQGTAAGQGPLVVAQAQTEAERGTARDADMKDSLGRFDDLIRAEREQIARERDAQAGAEGTGDGSGDGAEDGDGSGDDEEKSGSDGDSQSGEKKPGEKGDRSSGDLKSDQEAAGGTGSSKGQGQGQGPAAKDIPDGSDDDIIARQIREAAEKETDPELKEKLWKEYIEYKKNAQKK